MAQYLVAVRYGMMMTVENFQADVAGLRVGDTVIIHTQRGIEWGEVNSPPEELNRPVKGLGTLTRLATESDLGILQHIKESKEPEEMDYCRRCIKERKLPMKLIGVEHLFSSDKVVFYFLADGRVDFRDLVKDLARKYRTRIEMRQIGVRDEARLLADYEHCGRELCCRTFLRHLEPVTMRMAKTQKTTLDPSKISGHCGRLMCCLRFEDQVYNELRKELPKKGKTAVTPQFRGEVLSQDVLKQLVLLRMADGSREWVHVSEITEVQNRPGGNQQKASPRGRNSDRNNRGRQSEQSDQQDQPDRPDRDADTNAPPAAESQSD